MKKTYINPTIEVIDIKMNYSLLSGSPVEFDGNGSGNVNPSSEDPDEEEPVL